MNRIAVATGLLITGALSSSKKPAPTGMTVGTLSAVRPTVVLIDSQPTIYYELQLINRGDDTLVATNLFIRNEQQATVKDYAGTALYGAGHRLHQNDQAEAVLLPHDTAVVYIEHNVLHKGAGSIGRPAQYPTSGITGTVAEDHTPGVTGTSAGGPMPGNTRHRSQGRLRRRDTVGSTGSIRFYPVVGWYVSGDARRQVHTAKGRAIEALLAPPLVLGPPLGTGNWVSIYDPAWQRGHRRVIYAPDGIQRIPGRYAIDFMLLDAQGRYATGDENIINNWLGYGKEVIAVADGVVAAARDDFPESATLAGHPKYPSEKATGNYIAIDLGQGYFAFYEHLKPGSIHVRPGDVVKKGMALAKLGFTGQTTGPHLHFHVANALSPLGAEGVPFVFERFTQVGRYPDFGRFGKDPWKPALRTVSNERPAPNAVIRF